MNILSTAAVMCNVFIKCITEKEKTVIWIRDMGDEGEGSETKQLVGFLERVLGASPRHSDYRVRLLSPAAAMDTDSDSDSFLPFEAGGAKSRVIILLPSHVPGSGSGGGCGSGYMEAARAYAAGGHPVLVLSSERDAHTNTHKQGTDTSHQASGNVCVVSTSDIAEDIFLYVSSLLQDSFEGGKSSDCIAIEVLYTSHFTLF
jgi:hypothetical protein